LGAEEFGFATSPLIVLGCVMMRKCHMNTCPAGIATQDKELRKRFKGKPEYLINYFRFLAREVREYMALLGIRKFEELVGRSDLLVQRKDISPEKARTVNLERLLYHPENPHHNAVHYVPGLRRIMENELDKELIKLSARALQRRERVWISRKINNTDRATGSTLSGEIVRLYGEKGLPPDTIECTFYGSAGQSFGAFLTRGVSFRLEGDANDYLGKGLSGGKIIVIPPKGIDYKPEENIIIGNTVLYGATKGYLYVNGVAGERFAVRNSGAYAVVEGVGDHGCEYMTGGRVVVLGKTGRNFAAGMSGGIAYVLDRKGDFPYFCNQELVELTGLQDYEEVAELQELIAAHWHYTASKLAEDVLSHWDKYFTMFFKITPLEYKKVLNEQKLREINMKLKRAEFDPDFVE